MKLILITLCAVLISGVPAPAVETKPNIVFILADDLGWSDTTLFGTTKFYETPTRTSGRTSRTNRNTPR